MSVHKKLGIILESKVVRKLSLERNVFTKKIDNLKWNFFLEKFGWFLTSKIDFESTILAFFDKP